MSLMQPTDRGSQGIMRQKYVVVKQEDWENDLESRDISYLIIDGDYFVIRQSDVFGAATLYAYAHLIQTALELHVSRGEDVFTISEVEYLETLANDLVEKAQKWQADAAFKKVPD